MNGPIIVSLTALWTVALKLQVSIKAISLLVFTKQTWAGGTVELWRISGLDASCQSQSDFLSTAVEMSNKYSFEAFSVLASLFKQAFPRLKLV